MRIVVGNQKNITKYRIAIQKLASTKEKTEFRSITVYDSDELIDLDRLTNVIQDAINEYAKTLEGD